jgi:hypothetical protein
MAKIEKKLDILSEQVSEVRRQINRLDKSIETAGLKQFQILIEDLLQPIIEQEQEILKCIECIKIKLEEKNTNFD